ncbi:glycosyltransferase family protein [Desulfolutivibrio sulfoxidireducens]|uniref:glycosyltransferase family protein n=1 Tax=Desulfolutivibrio sulfoxidireducens TaxID=2773299 RepID=UPI00159D32B9|nr:glycosyltransferase [Desulfolutivibrio sulfoxidireducens]QLA16084.1 glycosyltransferase [Desulfolutivibrio sulfoxidireducens]
MNFSAMLKDVDAAIANGRLERAASLLRELLQAAPEDLALLERLARIAHLQRDERKTEAIRARIQRLKRQLASSAGDIRTRPLRVLFVQRSPCIRNYKMAQALGARGHTIVLAYTTELLSERYPGLSDDVYAQSVRIQGNQDLWRLSAGFDLVHCHNEPDVLSVAALAGDAPVIHDTHDLISLRDHTDPNVAFFEGIANRGAHGRIYTTPYQRREAELLYDVQGPSLVFYNYASAQDLPQRFHPKLSAQDGGLHFVYEGGISLSRHRDFNSIFIEIAARGAHVHIYPARFNEDLEVFFSRNPRIHYNRPVSPTRIMEEMTRFDIGIIPWNLEKGNKRFLDSTIANKLFEYLAAGLPVATANIQSYVEYFAANPVGVTFDTVEQLFAQGLPELSRMAKEVDFSKQVYTFEGEIDRVEEFYRMVLAKAGEGQPGRSSRG